MNKRMSAALAVLISMGLALYGIFLFAESEKERDLYILQAQMNLVVDSRAEALNGWLQAQYEVLSGLAQNESLQLYTTMVGMSGVDQQGNRINALAHTVRQSVLRPQ